MNIKYHINPDTGKPGVCEAQISCKFQKDGVEIKHYATLEEAFDAYEKSRDSEKFVSLSKKSKEIEDAEILDAPDNSILQPPTDSSILQPPTPTTTEEAPKETVVINIDEPAIVESANQNILQRLPELPNTRQSQLEKEAENWTSKVTAIDYRDPLFEEHSKSILSIGNEAFEKTSNISQNLVISNTSVRGKLSDSIGKQLSSLRNTVEDMVPTEGDFKGKLFGLVKGGTKWFSKFEKKSVNLEKINSALDNSIVAIKQDSANLDLNSQTVYNNLIEMKEAELKLRVMDKEISEKIEEAKNSGDLEKAQAISNKLLFPIRQQRQDVLTNAAVSVQSYISMTESKKYNEDIVNNIVRTKNTTSIALSTAVSLRSSLELQRNAIDGIKKTREVTNNVIEENAKMLKDNAINLSELNSTSSVSIETLNKAFKDTFEAINIADQSRTNAIEKLNTNIKNLESQIGQAVEYAHEKEKNIPLTSDAKPSIES